MAVTKKITLIKHRRKYAGASKRTRTYLGVKYKGTIFLSYRGATTRTPVYKVGIAVVNLEDLLEGRHVLCVPELIFEELGVQPGAEVNAGASEQSVFSVLELVGKAVQLVGTRAREFVASDVRDQLASDGHVYSDISSQLSALVNRGVLKARKVGSRKIYMLA